MLERLARTQREILEALKFDLKQAIESGDEKLIGRLTREIQVVIHAEDAGKRAQKRYGLEAPRDPERERLEPVLLESDLSTCVRVLREKAGLDQRALAEKSGLDRSHVARLEERGRNLTPYATLALANGFGFEPGDWRRELLIEKCKEEFFAAGAQRRRGRHR